MFVYSNHLMRDYLGNVRYVSGIYQYTDYDPLGKIIYSSNLDKNVYLYEGKERIPDIAEEYESVYDFGARYYNPLYGRWFAPDPAKQGINPYVYCGNNPIMLVDPDGRIWNNPQDMEKALGLLNARIKHLQFLLKNVELNMEGIDEMNMASDINDRIELLKMSIRIVKRLNRDKEHRYELEDIKDNYSRVRLGDNGVVYIQGSDFGFQLHEMIHVKQALENNRFEFEDGYLKNPGYSNDLKGEDLYKKMSEMEIEAYKVQYSYNGYFPLSNVSFNEIGVHTIGAIMNDVGKPVYPIIHKYSEHLKINPETE